jgi:hypothetical protein
MSERVKIVHETAKQLRAAGIFHRIADYERVDGTYVHVRAAGIRVLFTVNQTLSDVRDLVKSLAAALRRWACSWPRGRRNQRRLAASGTIFASSSSKCAACV